MIVTTALTATAVKSLAGAKLAALAGFVWREVLELASFVKHKLKALLGKKTP